MCVLVTTGLCSSADLDSTAEMLKQLQDSGVLNNVKAELEKMMKDPSQRATLQDAILAREKELRAKINEQLNEIDDEDAKSGVSNLSYSFLLSISYYPYKKSWSNEFVISFKNVRHSKSLVYCFNALKMPHFVFRMR